LFDKALAMENKAVEHWDEEHSRKGDRETSEALGASLDDRGVTLDALGHPREASQDIDRAIEIFEHLHIQN
jgi:hypothetical protein